MNGPAVLPASSTAPSSAAAAGATTASAAILRGLSIGGDRQDQRLHIHFRVAHETKWGEHVVLLGSGALLGNFNVQRCQPLRCHQEQQQLMWELLVTLPWQHCYKYRYAVVTYDEAGRAKIERQETQIRTLVLHEQLAHGDIVEVVDTWAGRSCPGNFLASSAFTKVIHANKPVVSGGQPRRRPPAVAEAVVRFSCSDLMMAAGAVMCVTGGAPQLGSWQADQAFELTETDTPQWEGEIRLPFQQFPFTYKYAIRLPSGQLLLEVGEPRVAALPLAGSSRMGAPALLVHHDGVFRREQMWRGAGVAVPVFSLRSRRGVGVGEFEDLKLLVDWAAGAGLRLVQVLPVNDTSVYNSWWDSYPYSTASVLALHPQYLALDKLADDLPASIVKQIDEAREKLNLENVDYEGTMKAKLGIARQVFDGSGRQELQGEEYQEWFAANQSWLVPYAAFCWLRDLFGTAEHWRWGAMARPTEELLQRVTGPGTEWHGSIAFTYWLQWQLHRQLLAASQYAAGRRVVLKGDIPIGVDKRSVDTWLAPQYFRMDKSTGAPPDYFDPNGQNWGFPTYDWEAMAADNYAWWRRRLCHMAQYFEAYRIDHVLGFFRIWEVPGNCATGLLGRFRPAHPISRQELETRGLWDIQRLVRPYIRRHLMEQAFGSMAQEVAAKYLEETGPGVYAFRPEWSTEAAIAGIQPRADSPEWLRQEVAAVRKGLLALRQNVLLLVDEADADKFYPRIGLISSSSFKELEPSWREVLARLHDDHFFKRQDELWRSHALETLPALLDATDMMVCGEDLGFVPACVPPVMQELGLLGLRIQRMPTQENVEFNNPAAYPYLAVASPSCHDVTPIRAWWEEDAERRERFFYTALGGSGTPPAACTPEVVAAVVQQHLDCPSAWAIFPIQDLMALSPRYCSRPAREEVINDPTVTKHYWRFRLQPTLEELLADGMLTELLQDMVLASGRCSLEELQ